MATEPQPQRHPLASLDLECFHCLKPLVWRTDFDGNGGEFITTEPIDGIPASVCLHDPDLLDDEGVEHTRHVPDRRPFYVNVYATDRHYGGPEEGGWWYDCGEPVASTPYLTRAAARDALVVAQAQFPYTGKRNSVLGGEDWSCHISREFAVAYPTTRPRYE